MTNITTDQAIDELKQAGYKLVDAYVEAGGDAEMILMSQNDYRRNFTINNPTLDEILDEYENGQNPTQSEEYRLNKAKAALSQLLANEVRKAETRGETRGRIDELENLKQHRIVGIHPKKGAGEFSAIPEFYIKDRITELKHSLDGQEGK